MKEEVSKIIHGEQMMQRERNARSTMTTSIMIQSLKMIDLFEEKCEYIDSLDRIVVKTTEMGVKLDEREGFKSGLEGENEVHEKIQKQIKKLTNKLFSNFQKFPTVFIPKRNQQVTVNTSQHPRSN